MEGKGEAQSAFYGVPGMLPDALDDGPIVLLGFPPGGVRSYLCSAHGCSF
ncbi:MAG: hypothetical protein ABIN91_17690 [Mucilaginibacter sp.]